MKTFSKASKDGIGYLFASPWLTGFFLLTFFPLLGSLLLSFSEWDGMSWSRLEWVGFDQYQKAMADPFVHTALRNTVFYSLLAVPGGVLVSLMIAVLLNQKLKGITIFRTIYFMPYIIGGIATIMMWLQLFNPDFGLLNLILRAIGSALENIGILSGDWKPPGWIYDERWAKPALIMMSWWGAGGPALIFLAALQNVPPQLYESAQIDGAGRIQRFRHITVPQISPAIFFNLVMGVIASFQVFNEAFIMTSGGPNDSTLFFVLYLYNKGFIDFEIGYASALAWILFIIILVLTLCVVKSSKLWVHYQGEE